MGFYFNMTDVDKNGVITVPEFIKLALNFGGDVKEGDSDVVKVTRNPTWPLFWSNYSAMFLYVVLRINCDAFLYRNKECRLCAQ